MASTQVVLSNRSGWRVTLSKNWDVLGPFPIQAREQHFLSPSFPLNLSQPVDLQKIWSSSYADGGKVSWGTTSQNDKGDIQISFPSIRWPSLRATEGWAVLQHHAVLRTSLTLHPPNDASPSHRPPHLVVKLTQGSFFTVIPAFEPGAHSSPLIPEWYAGNIYDMECTSPRLVHLPTIPLTNSPTKYEVFVSGDYEIRLFGDPRSSGSEVPVQSINFMIDIDVVKEEVVREPTQDVICDFVGGYAFGDAIGIGLRSVSGWWTVTDVTLASQSTQRNITVNLLRETRIAPTQTRVIPVSISQTAPFRHHELRLDLTVASESTSSVISLSLPVAHRVQWTPDTFVPIRASHFFAESTPTVFLALPPVETHLGEPCPPILALHGAGVDIVGQTFWAESISRQRHSWVVLPSGRTSWGLDWHGPSAQDAWDAVDALASILNQNSIWHPWQLKDKMPVIVMGHSNGGQGAWYMASRFPDRVLAVVPAAGYIKSQAYVPLTQSRSGHFIDPSLRAILESALTPDDNDLFLSNLVDTPVLAIHGGDDENVPVWHSREALNVLQIWKPDAKASLQEDPFQPHWYPSVLNNEMVQAFLDSIVSSSLQRKSRSKLFTLTVSIPIESGSLHGWQIESLDLPGRQVKPVLGRIHVKEEDGTFKVKTTNVNSFSTRYQNITRLVIDGAQVPLVKDEHGLMRFRVTQSRIWQAMTTKDTSENIQASGRLQAVLSSAASLLIIIPTAGPSRELSIALRIAHDLNTYHKLDAEILQSSEAVQQAKNGCLGHGNIVVVGDTQTPFARRTLAQKKTPFELEGTLLKLKGRSLIEPGLGIVFLHPHPTCRTANMLFISGTDTSGLERAARLFPIRTGIAVPDWLIIGGWADDVGSAGVIGAGVWGREWQWNEPMSWYH